MEHVWPRSKGWHRCVEGSKARDAQGREDRDSTALGGQRLVTGPFFMEEARGRRRFL